MKDDRIIEISHLIFPLMILIFGAWLVYLGAYAQVKISFLNQNLESSSVGIAVIFLAAVVYVFSYKSYLKHKVANSQIIIDKFSSYTNSIDGNTINFHNDEVIKTTEFWYYVGHTGKYVRTTVAPRLCKISKESGHIRHIYMLLMNPSHGELADVFKEYKNATNGRTPEDNLYLASLYGTILSANILKNEFPLLKFEIGLLDSFGVFRIDICSSYVLITTQSKRDPAIMINRDSPFYELWRSNFEIQTRLAKSINLYSNLDITFQDLKDRKKIDYVKELFERNRLNIYTKEFLESVIKDALTFKNPYA